MITRPCLCGHHQAHLNRWSQEWFLTLITVMIILSKNLLITGNSMTDKQKMEIALSELKGMGLSPTDTLNVQILLGMQQFFRSLDTSEVNAPFVDWTLTDMCRALKVKERP